MTTAAARPARPPHTVVIDHAVWRQFNEWTRALGIELVRIPCSPGQYPRYAMTPRSARAAYRSARAGGLSERELQVLGGMAAGKTNAEIGKEHFLPEDTVKTHARKMFKKLGVSDRAGAVATGFRLGILS